MATELSRRGAFKIAVSEGMVPAPYYDVVGVLTYGVGHTRPAGAPDPRSIPMAFPKGEALEAAMVRSWQVYRKDMAKFTADVVSELGPDLKQHELDGWVSFHFNTGGIRRTSAVAKWKAGDKDGAMRVLNQWVNGTVNGRKTRLQALVTRRRQESDLILTGQYPGGTLPIWRTNGAGRVSYSNPVKTFTYDQWEKWLRQHGFGPASPSRAPVAGVGAVVGGGVVAAVSYWDRIVAWFETLIGGLF